MQPRTESPVKGAYRFARDFDPEADFSFFGGDCLELLGQIPDGAARLVMTSPPYNIGKPYEDRSSLDDYVEFQREVITESVRVLADDGSICWQVGNPRRPGRDRSARCAAVPRVPGTRTQDAEPDGLALRAWAALHQAILRPLRDHQLVHEGGRLRVRRRPDSDAAEVPEQAPLQRPPRGTTLREPTGEEPWRRLGVPEREEQPHREDASSVPVPCRAC